MKKHLVLLLAASTVFGLVGCDTASSSVPTTSEAPTTSEVAATVTSVTVTNVGDDTINVKGTTSLVAVVNGTGDFSQLVSWSSDNEEIATVTGKGVVTGVGGGEATITATSVADNTVSGSVKVTVKSRAADYAVTSLADVISADKHNSENVYLTHVKVSKWQGSNTNGTKYGNFYVTDVDGGNETLVYGATATASAFALNATTETWSFTNPKDFLTNSYTSAIAVGDELDMVLTRCDYNSTIEVTGIILTIKGAKIPNGDAAKASTVAAFAADEGQQNLYLTYVTGKISAWYKTNTNGTAYGNFYISDDGTETDQLLVYGASVGMTFSYDASTGKIGKTSPKDWLTNASSKDLTIGDSVTLLAYRSDYNGTKEIIGQLIVA